MVTVKDLPLLATVVNEQALFLRDEPQDLSGSALCLCLSSSVVLSYRFLLIGFADCFFSETILKFL